MIDISIIIISYNTKKLTLSCIESIVGEGSKLKKEVVVVDNNSSDDSVKAIEESIKSITHLMGSGHASTRGFLIKNEENLGFAKAVNQGIKKAKGKHILLLNSDCKVKKGALGKLLEFAKNTEDAGVVGAKLLNPNGSVQKSCYNFPTLAKAIGQYWLKKNVLLDKFVPDGSKPQEVDAVVGAAFLITPEARKLVGLLDERYFMYFEDIDYCRRVKRASLKVYYLPSAQVIHAHGASPEPEQVRFRVNGTKKGRETKWNYLKTSSKIYHGVFKYYLFNFIVWSGQKWERIGGK